MFKHLTLSFLTIALTSTSIASNIDDQYCEQNNQDIPHTQHPAEYPTGDKSPISLIPRDVAILISRHLPPKDALSLTETCKKFNTYKQNILLLQIPNAYKDIGEMYDEVFLDIDHAQWTPDVMSKQMTFTLHFDWYLNAKRKLSKENVSDEEKYEAFRLFYAAGCLGHVLAAKEAGLMLMDPNLNDLIPTVITYEHLPAEAKNWDIRRLGEHEEKRPILQDALQHIEALYEDELTDPSITVADPAGEIKFIENVIENISKKKQDDDVKGFMIFAEELIDHLRTNNELADFDPIHTLDYAKKLESASPFLQRLIDIEYYPDYHSVAYQLAKKSLDIKMSAGSLDRMGAGFWYLNYSDDVVSNSKEALLNTQNAVTFDRAAQFLGPIHTAGWVSISDLNYPGLADVNVQKKTNELSSEPLQVFLHYLNITRNVNEAKPYVIDLEYLLEEKIGTDKNKNTQRYLNLKKELGS